MSPLQLGGLVGSGIRGAGSRMMPALDYLATSLIGDNPALTGALRCVPLGLETLACGGCNVGVSGSHFLMRVVASSSSA